MQKPVSAKIEAIHVIPRSFYHRELQRFLGMAGYYCSFCKIFSSVAAPLTDLLNPKTFFKWSPECQHAFEFLKALLMHVPVLAAPVNSYAFKLAIDAGAGAVLLHDGPDGIKHPGCYFSKKFQKRQKQYLPYLDP